MNNYHQLLIKEIRETVMCILNLISTPIQGSEVIRWVKTPHGCRQAHIHMPTHMQHTRIRGSVLHSGSTCSNISIFVWHFHFSARGAGFTITSQVPASLHITNWSRAKLSIERKKKERKKERAGKHMLKIKKITVTSQLAELSRSHQRNDCTVNKRARNGG